jgi:VanZ family protein
MQPDAADKPRGRAGNPFTPWIPAVIWSLVVYTLSAQTALPNPRQWGITDKMAHFAVFAVLGLALAYGRYRSPRRPPHGLLVAAGLLYGVLDEVHQTFVPNRHPDVADFIADAAGVLVGYGVVVLAAAVVGAVSRRLTSRRLA